MEKKFVLLEELVLHNPVIKSLVNIFNLIQYEIIEISFLGENRKVISTRKETIDEINQALSISPENPLCILQQEVAKTFLLQSNTQKKYQVSFIFIYL